MSGLFIVVEGIDGSGKSTMVNRLVNELSATGYKARPTRQPGGTPLAEKLRSLVLDWDDAIQHEQMLAKTEYLIMMAARHQLVELVIKPQVAAGYTMISDRHDWSSLAFQGIDNSHIREFASMEPDLVVYLDRDVDAAKDSVIGRGDDISKYETDERQRNAFNTYRKAYRATPCERTFRINANDFDSIEFKQSVNALLTHIQRLLEAKNK